MGTPRVRTTGGSDESERPMGSRECERLTGTHEGERPSIPDGDDETGDGYQVMATKWVTPA